MKRILKFNKEGNFRLMKKILFYGVMIALVSFFFACEEKECDESLRNDAGFGFYTLQENEETDTTLPPLSVYAKNRPDSLLYDSAVSRRNVRLPLNPGKDFTHYVFVIDSMNDTIQINYTRELNLVSQACGFITDFNIKQVSTSHHHFDSIVVINKTITQNENEEHFKIYLSAPDTTGQ